MRLLRKLLVARIPQQQILTLQQRGLIEQFGRPFHDPTQVRQPAAELLRTVETMALGQIGNFQGAFVFLANDGRVEPVLVADGVRNDERRHRLHRVAQPIGRHRVAQHAAIQIKGHARRERRGGAVEQRIDQPDLEDPQRAAALKTHGRGKGRIAAAHLASLVQSQGVDEIQPGTNLGAGHVAVADGDASFGHPIQRGLGFAQCAGVLGRHRGQRNHELPRIFALGPSFGQRQGGIHPLVVSDQMVHESQPERFFQYAGIVEVHGRVGGFVEVLGGGDEIARRQSNAAQFEQHHAGQRVIVLAPGDNGSFEHGLGLRVASGAGIGHAQLYVDPSLGPVVGNARAAR